MTGQRKVAEGDVFICAIRVSGQRHVDDAEKGSRLWIRTHKRIKRADSAQVAYIHANFPKVANAIAALEA